MPGPRLRTVSKASAPFDLNKFPRSFVDRFAEEIVYLHATRSPVSIEGKEWEQIFASCIDAEWKPSNVGLDDVVLDNCCWSAKTVKSAQDLGAQREVRLISGRNSPTYSFGEGTIGPEADPEAIGEMVLDIWNERVSGIRQLFKFVRTVVLVKSNEHDEFLIFESETVRYDPDLYRFAWNSRNNLEGFDKRTGQHRFTWQPHGSQFTIIEKVPPERLHVKIRVPEQVSRSVILEAVGFRQNDFWTMELP